jgi:hypothetical protein
MPPKKTKKPQKGRAPTSDLAKRVGLIFHRKPETLWNPREIIAFRARLKEGCFEQERLSLIEEFYKKARPPHYFPRKDLKTLLNNWQGEEDKARDWKRKQPKPRTNIIPMPPIQSAPETMPVLLGPELEQHARFMLEFGERKQRRVQ